MSRTTVWKALQGLEQWGVTLFKVHGRGYRLVTPVDWLEVAQIERHLGAQRERAPGPRRGHGGIHQQRLLLAEAQAGAPSGLTLAAELQTRGRGRRGRSWHTGLGGALTFSVLWRFEQGVGALHGLSLAVSVALVRALRSLGATETMVKWPNDVLWRQQKLAGVLIELQGDVMGPSAAVIGIGINVRLDEKVREPHRPGGRPTWRSRGAAASQPQFSARCSRQLAEVLGVVCARAASRR